ncbi:MAG: hypothetical protein J6Y62_00120 [Clostridia bacterium]|nr:hypothetical protein [Clostridia bacterium]
MKLNENTYWNEKGRYQEEYDKLWEELVPGSGAAKTLQGEILRAAGRLYYRFFNDGDMIVDGGTDPDSSAVEAWGFLYNLPRMLCSSNATIMAMRGFVISLAEKRRDEEGYAAVLEIMIDAAVRYAADSEPIPNSFDFIDNKYKDVCHEIVGFAEEYDEEEYENYEEEEEEAM